MLKILYSKKKTNNNPQFFQKMWKMEVIGSKNMELKEKSCGCIIIEDNKVLLIKQTRGNWGFPKGHEEENETEQETAIREVKEETNLDVKIIGNSAYKEEYYTDKGKLKEVVYFIAKKVGGEIKPQEMEVSQIEWFSFSDAIEKITYEDTKGLFKRVLKDENLDI